MTYISYLTRIVCIVARFSLTFKGPNPENFFFKGEGSRVAGGIETPQKMEWGGSSGGEGEEAQSQYKNRLGQVKRRRKKKKLDQGEEG